jgi:ribosomal protein L21
MVEDSPEPNIINEDNPSEGYISMDKVLLPKGVEITLRDVLSGVENDYIVINEDYIITSGFDVYLDHVKQGKKIIKVKKRIRNLEKIKLSLF